MPTYLLFGLILIGVGISVQTFTTTANSVLQLSTEPFMRGRIIAMFMAIALGTTPIGAPIVGWIADHFGARWALGVGAASGFVAIVGIYYLLRYQSGSRKNQHYRLSVRTNPQQEASTSSAEPETEATEV